MSKSIYILLEHITQSCQLVTQYIKGKTKEKFLEDVGLQDKVIRRLAIIGEAVKGLPEDFRLRHSKIPWQDIAGMRDILVHEYYDVDAPLVWKVATKRIPQLFKYIVNLLKDSPK